MFLCLAAGRLGAAEEGDKAVTEHEAITTGDPAISVEELDLRLRPLRRDEVKVEAEAWLALTGSASNPGPVRSQ